MKNKFFFIINEIKLRIIYVLFTFLITFLINYFYSEKLIYIMCKPFLIYIKNNNTQIFLHDKININENVNLVFTDLSEIFYLNIFISFFFTLYLIMPLILYQLFCFFSPSLYKKKKIFFFKFSFIYLILIFSLIMLIQTYFLEKILYFFLNLYINNVYVNINYMPRIKSYIYIYAKIIFFFTLIFTFIYFIFFFVKKYVLYILHYKNKNYFKHKNKNKKKKIFFILIFSSIMAPPDIFFQILLFFTLFFFFEICICIIFIFIKIINFPKK